MSFTIGQMKQFLTVQTVATTVNSSGGSYENWSDSFPSWAKVENLSGGRQQGTGEVFLDNTYRFTFWWREGFDFDKNKFRIKYNDGFKEKVFTVSKTKVLKEESFIVEAIANYAG